MTQLVYLMMPLLFNWKKRLQEANQKAINYYKKAQRQALYLHEPAAGLAKAYFYLGDKSKAITAIKRALENTHNQSMVALYKAKHDYFKSKQTK